MINHSLKALPTTAVVWLLIGCWYQPDDAVILPARESSSSDFPDSVLVARIVQITDIHVVDTLSPARFAGAHGLTESAWRPWEAYSMQILDGIIRTTNRIHASGQRIDFVLCTGDLCDNAQSNELGWFLGVMDGAFINPLSGPDDRAPDDRPIPEMDPYAGFQPQGLYRSGIHGDLPTISWYGVIGNHDTYGLGVFPIVTLWDGTRVSPLPLHQRPGVLLPTVFDPTGCWAHGNVTPARPGPPELLELVSYVAPNPERAYFSKRELVRAMFGTSVGPVGHGFADPENGPAWYSYSPAPGLRLIGLDTSDRPLTIPGLPYPEGCISDAQAAFLRNELDVAQEHGELVVVASHHPSQSLDARSGSAMAPGDFQDLLNAYPNVVLHLAGHLHRNRVADRGGYLEIETCSTLDLPQEARVIEVWRDPADGTVTIGYHMFSDTDETLAPLGEDPLSPMRAEARRIAEMGAAVADRYKRSDGADGSPQGSAFDRAGWIRLRH